MNEAQRPLLALGAPTVAQRVKQKPLAMPRASRVGAARQKERLTPQFRELAAAFDAERARLGQDVPDEVDPELVVVFDLAGSIGEFRNAVNRIDGLEFLSELLGDESDPDDDFYMTEVGTGRTTKPVPHSLYMVMTNSRAIEELLRLFAVWQQDPSAKFEHGLGKFKDAFQQLSSIRRWGPEDRVRETGLLDAWREHLEFVGQSVSTVMAEIELWYRGDPGARTQAEDHVTQVVVDSGGRVLQRSQIGEIGYHALLAELPVQQAETVLTQGAASIRLLTTDDVMLVGPFAPMSVTPASEAPAVKVQVSSQPEAAGLPRIALLDGYPFTNHDALRGRLSIDDPDSLESNYPVLARNHGTAMASLILHGDLSIPGDPLERPLYVRPIMRPHEINERVEQVFPDKLFTDVLHQAVRRIVVGDGSREAVAPSVRIVSLSLGAPTRALVRRMSPVGRLLDWLAYEYNLLFVVSAGNHVGPITVPADAATDLDRARTEAVKYVYGRAILRGIFPPGDALNALTVGATHEDGLSDHEVPDTVWDLTRPGAPALYGATGPGVGRSIKPDILHSGGRAFFTRPVSDVEQGTATAELLATTVSGPGHQVAAPGRGGATNLTVFTNGTSNAAALVTREASRIFDILEAGASSEDDIPLPDAQYHPLLVRALLAHASSWGPLEGTLRRDLGISNQDARRRLTPLLGYGRLDTSRLGAGAANRAVLVAGGSIGRDERRTYGLPLPTSLQAVADWHRITITLASMAPTIGQRTQYRGSKVYFVTPDTKLGGGDRIDAEHNAVRRGSLQHEIVEGNRAMVFGDGDSFPIHVECMNHAQRLGAGESIRYALVVSIETALQTSTTIHDEVRTRLRERVRGRATV
ncbi:S8 family peptidase [Isoptericola sp. NPDC055881]